MPIGRPGGRRLSREFGGVRPIGETFGMNAKARLEGVTLQAMLTELVEEYGWEGLGDRISIKCFLLDPSMGSSLTFLRKTPWARTKVERLYLLVQKDKAERGIA
jgi:uncharacterized protein (DUF2132 family)